MNTGIDNFPNIESFEENGVDASEIVRECKRWREAFLAELTAKLATADVNYSYNPNLYTKGRIEVLLDVLGRFKTALNNNPTNAKKQSLEAKKE
jgi:hypothetical protein